MSEGAGLMSTIQSVLAQMDATEGQRFASEEAALRAARHRAFLVAVYNRGQSVSARFLPRWLRLRGGREWGTLRGTATKTPTAGRRYAGSG